MMLCCPLGGLVSASFGRRLTILMSAVPCAVSWIVIATAREFPVVLVGRVVGALSPSLFMAAVGVYVSEISHPHYRGSLASIQSCCLSFGMLVSYSLGYLLHYRQACWVALAVPAATLVSMYFQPETPYWLVENGREGEARCSKISTNISR